MRIMIDGVAVECRIGNITAQNDIAAIVNPAAPGLAPGPGVSGAIHSKAGTDLYQECIRQVSMGPGKAIITGGYLLPNRHVIHCIPPKGRTDQGRRQLEECYINSLLLANDNNVQSIAFPSLVSGTFGTPPVSSAAVALGAVRSVARMMTSLRQVRFVLFDRQIYLHYRNLMAANPESILQARVSG